MMGFAGGWSGGDTIGGASAGPGGAIRSAVPPEEQALVLPTPLTIPLSLPVPPSLSHSLYPPPPQMWEVTIT